MVDVYSVSTRLTISDARLIAGLRRVAEQIRTLDAEMMRLQNRMKGLQIGPGGRPAFGETTRNVREFARSVGEAERKTASLSRTMSQMPASSIIRAQRAVDEMVGRQMSAVGGSTMNAAQMLRARRATDRMVAAQYDGRQMTPREILAARRRVDAMANPAEPGGRGGGPHRLFEGVGMAYMGMAGLHAIGHALKPAKEYQHELALMDQTSMKHEERVQAIAQAWKTTGQVLTTNVAGNLSSIMELRQVFGGEKPEQFQHALQNLGMIQKIQGLLGTYAGVGKAGEGQAYTLAKALEIRGAVKTPEEFGTEAEMMAKAIGASRGRVTAQDFLSAFKFGRTATQGWSKEFTYEILPTMIQELKSKGGSGGAAGGPGNPLMSGFAAIVGGTLPQKALSTYKELGLLDESKLIYSKGGTLRGVKPGGVKGWDLYTENPFRWINEVVMPAMNAKGLTDAQKVQRFQYLFQNRTAGALASQMGMRGYMFERDVPLYRGQAGIASYDDLMKKDPNLLLQALGDQFKVVGTALGEGIMRGALPLMAGGAVRLNAMGVGLHDRPGLATGIGGGLIGLAGLASVGIMVRGIAFALGGLAMIPGLATVGAALSRVAGGLAMLSGAALGAKALYEHPGDVAPGAGLYKSAMNLLHGRAPWDNYFPMDGQPTAGGPGLTRYGSFADRERESYTPLGELAGQGTKDVLRDHESIGSVSLQGETTLTGQIVVNMGEIGSHIQEFILRGISRAMGSPSTTGARPDGYAASYPNGPI